MAFDPGAISAALAAAVGDDAALIAELRGAFTESAVRAATALGQARSDTAWVAAALRLKGLAASFGAVRLMALADAAANGPACDAAMLKKVNAAIRRL